MLGYEKSILWILPVLYRYNSGRLYRSLYIPVPVPVPVLVLVLLILPVLQVSITPRPRSFAVNVWSAVASLTCVAEFSEFQFDGWHHSRCYIHTTTSQSSSSSRYTILPAHHDPTQDFNQVLSICSLLNSLSRSNLSPLERAFPHWKAQSIIVSSYQEVSSILYKTSIKSYYMY